MNELRFADGLRHRIEIPSVEGLAEMRAVLEKAEARSMPRGGCRRAPGVMTTEVEIAETAQLGATTASRCRCSSVRAAPGIRAASRS